MTTKPISNTPETDQLEDEFAGDPSCVGYYEALEVLARKLERERDKVIKMLKDLTKQN